MSVQTLIKVVEGVRNLKGHLDDLDKYSKAADRATKGKDPFPPPKKVQEALKKLEVLEGQLKSIAKNGIKEPDQKKVSIDMLADPKTRDKAKKLLVANLKAREAFAVEAGKLAKKVAAIQKDAALRKKAAYEISKVFGKLVDAPLPDLGTIGKVAYFEYYQLFQKASSTMGGIESATVKASARIKKDLKKIEGENKTMRANLKTFGVL